MFSDRSFFSFLWKRLSQRGTAVLFRSILSLAVFSLILFTQDSIWGIAPLERLKQQGQLDLVEQVTRIEQTWKQEYATYFEHQEGDRPTSALQAPEIATFLTEMDKQTGKRPALVYLRPLNEALQIVVVTPNGNIYQHLIEEANRENLLKTTQEFRKTITHPRYTRTTRYQPSAEQLYRWIISPIEDRLEAEEIDTLLLCVGEGLRSIPFAALFDGDRFLVENYSLTIIPAFNLMTAEPENAEKQQVLAMGASEFEHLSPLPAVPLELQLLSQSRTNSSTTWDSQAFLNEKFTLENLQTQLKKHNFDIVHLATHAEFRAGEPKESYIQLWDTQLTLDQIRQLPLDNPPLNLLVLSACQTAMGDPKAELGFAGLAFESGVQSALASLWSVSDTGTLALMSEFYQSWYSSTKPIKAEALRQAQIALLRGEVQLSDRQLRGSRGNVELPPTLHNLVADNLAAPYYWAAFTLIGSPW